MKFEVGDVLVDAGRDPEEPRMSAEVIKASEEFKQYTIRVANGKVFNYPSASAEWIWRKAPIGTVAWLIHELSKHDPTDSVSICQWNTNGWKVDVKDVEIINKFGEGAVTLW